MSFANSSAPLTLGELGSLLRPIFILMGSAAKLPVERTNKKATTLKRLIRVERDTVFFMAYLLLIKSISVKMILLDPQETKK
jgi:hypothetical protein